MISPHSPGQKGNDKPTVHGGRPDADHEKEVRKADIGGNDMMSGEEKAGADERTPVGEA